MKFQGYRRVGGLGLSSPSHDHSERVEPGRSTNCLEKWFEERSPGRLSDAKDVTYYITSSLRNDLRSTVVHGPCKVLKTNSEPLHVVFWGRICFGKP